MYKKNISTLLFKTLCLGSLKKLQKLKMFMLNAFEITVNILSFSFSDLPIDFTESG